MNDTILKAIRQASKIFGKTSCLHFAYNQRSNIRSFKDQFDVDNFPRKFQDFEKQD